MLPSPQAKLYQQECAVSFDPGEYSVKAAVKKLDGLSVEDLSAVLALELDGKHRSSMVAEIGKAIDALKTEAEEVAEEEVAEEEVVEEEVVEEEAAPEPVTISALQYNRLHRNARKSWSRLPNGRYSQ